MNTRSGKHGFEERLRQQVQELLAHNGVDESTLPDSYEDLVDGLFEYVKAETRRSYINGLQGRQSRPQRPGRDTRFDIQGKPSAMHAGVMQRARGGSEYGPE